MVEIFEILHIYRDSVRGLDQSYNTTVLRGQRKAFEMTAQKSLSARAFYSLRCRRCIDVLMGAMH